MKVFSCHWISYKIEKLFMLIQYEQQCCAYVQSTVHVTESDGGMVLFLSRIHKYTCLNLGPEIGNIGWRFVELP